MPRCSKNFITQYAHVNDAVNKTHVDEYIKMANKNDSLTCDNGHELLLVNGEKRAHHFRHKNVNDTESEKMMSEWHSRMQSYFPTTEKCFKMTKNQYKNRRADVFIEKSKTVIEIQHSDIDDANVICRDHDYKEHGSTVIWLIDGNTPDVELETISSGGYLLTFNKDWKYKSFTKTYDFVMLDIDDKIFKIPVKQVCMRMILVKEHKPIEVVVDHLLKDAKTVWDLWEDDNEIKATLTVHQQGAGNGKTFGIWKSIANNKDKDTFIIITGQHTAKQVIKKELDDQAEREEFHVVSNMDNVEQGSYGKQLIVEYEHKFSGKKCIVIIGTVLSFMYALSGNKKANSNYFEGLVNTIIDDGCEKINRYSGDIRYGGRNLRLNKKVEIWIDEVQDLGANYYQAIIRIMLMTKVDVVIVGDKLQSLEHEDNFISKASTEESTKNLTIIKHSPVNVNRRIKVKKMSKSINDVIHFDKYGLEPITSEYEDTLEELSDDALEILEYPHGSNFVKSENLRKFVRSIVDRVDKEVRENDYKPNDFLFVFPILSGNNIATELETTLNKYWIDKNEDEKRFKEYVQLHKHQEGQVIDTSESVEKTRIMSIKASKGDGRNVVFVLGCSEKTLKIVSGHEINLVYESHLHVALTRAKRKIYFGLDTDNDDIRSRFGHIGYAEYKPKCSTSLSVAKVLQFIDKNKLISLLQEYGVKEPEKKPTKPGESSETVEWGFHCIRRSICLQFAMFCIYNLSSRENFKTSQIKVILDKLSKLNIIQTNPYDFYKLLHSCDDDDELDCFPLCIMSNKNKYHVYFEKLRGYMEQLNNNYRKHSVKSLADQTPIEAVIQHYMIDIYKNKKYHSISPMEIYKIIDYFETGTSKEVHLLNEAKKIKDITNEAVKDIFNQSSNPQWNLEHVVLFNGKTRYMKLHHNYELIGNDNDVVYHLRLQTDYNELTYWETMISILIERFLLFNPMDKGKDISKFKKKKIITNLFILKQSRHEVFDWDWDGHETVSKEIKYELKKAFMKHFASTTKQIFYQYNFIKNKKEVWSSFRTPLKYMADQYKDIRFIMLFFEDLHNRVERNETEEVKRILGDEDLFSKEMTTKCERMCDDYFDMNDVTDIEW
jgi:hypothetical protein